MSSKLSQSESEVAPKLIFNPTVNDNILKSLCITSNHGKLHESLERFHRLYRQKTLTINNLFTRSLYLLQNIEYELDNIKKDPSDETYKDFLDESGDLSSLSQSISLPKSIASVKPSIQLLQERVKVVQCVMGIVLYFHYESLLRPQIQIIAKVINALINGTHALLESPTGTGKTAALVAAITSWLKFMSSKNEPSPKSRVQVYYITRTHSQITQVHKELRQCCFRLDVACLGSRIVTCPMITNKDSIISADSFCKSVRSVTEMTRFNSLSKSMNHADNNHQGCKYYRGLESKDFSAMIHLRCRTLVQQIAEPDRVKSIDSMYKINDGYWDIEELVDICTKGSEDDSKTNNKKQKLITTYVDKHLKNIGCPYYVSKSLSSLSDVVICPYSYVLDYTLAATDDQIVEAVMKLSMTKAQHRQLTRAMSQLPERVINAGARLPLKNNVIIIDEAHNIESFCKEKGSFEISQSQIRNVKSWLRSMLNFNTTNDSVAKILDALHDNIAQIYDFIDSFSLKLKEKCQRIGNLNTKIYSWDKYDSKEDRLGGTSEFLAEFELSLLHPFLALMNLYYISSFSNLLSDVINFESPIRNLLESFLVILVLVCYHHKFYTVCLVDKTGTFEINFWLHHASVIFDTLANKTKSLILISGTLAPLSSTSSSLGDSFVKRLGKCTLEASHVISIDQFLVLTLSKMPNSCLNNGVDLELECVYRNLQKDEFIISLGVSIAKLVYLLPGNVLIFFPNRNLVQRCVDLWKERSNAQFKSRSIYNMLAGAKQNIFIEPRSAIEFHKIVDEMKSDESFILLSPFRGHASEGLNLSVKSLVLIGLPFANKNDPYVDASIRFASALGVGSDWYVTDTYRAINQSIGRCIRKMTDKGIVLLLDSRHYRYGSASGLSKNLSSWIRPHLKHSHNFDHLEQLIKTHVKKITEME